MNGYLFSLLGIEPTDNVKEVKIAYAKTIKQYHPEENPEEWKQIHDAYTQIMDYLSKKEQPVIKAGTVIRMPSTNPNVKMPAEPKKVKEEKSESGTGEEKIAEPIIDKSEDEYEEISTIVNDAGIKYQENSELKLSEQRAIEIDREKYKDLIVKVRTELKDNGVPTSDKPRISVYTYERIRKIPGYMNALKSSTFVEGLYGTLNNFIYDNETASNIIHDIDVAKQSNTDSKDPYDNIIQYLKGKGIYRETGTGGSGNRGGSERGGSGRTIYIIAAIGLLIFRLSLSWGSHNDEQERRDKAQLLLQQQLAQPDIDKIIQDTKSETDPMILMYKQTLEVEYKGDREAYEKNLRERGYEEENIKYIFDRIDNYE